MDDFNINKLVLDTLKPVGVPVYFSSRKENTFPLVLFNVTDERGWDYWDDEEQVTKYSIMINIFSKGNYIPIKNKIKELMINAGFIRKEIPTCHYQDDLDVYNQPMIFDYYR